MGTLVFIIVLSILVIVHEMGHFIVAKSLGIKVERFAIGFGPKIFGKILRDTEFLVCLIPLGGYVKMAGDEREECKGEKEEFYSKAVGLRSLVVIAGPVVNYIFAFLCFCIVFFAGYPAVTTQIGELVDDYPAMQAGFAVNDKILSIDSNQMNSWEDVQKYISNSKGAELDVLVMRGNKKKNISLAPISMASENIFGQKIESRVVGIRSKEEIVLLRYGVVESIAKAAEKLKDITFTTYKALYLMVTGAMSAKDAVTGPIGIFYIIKKAASMGFSYVMYIMAVISASLAIFNLLPFPVLDGGHLLLFGIEKIKGKPLSRRVDEIINRIGFSLIICLAVFVFYTDFVRYGIFDKIVQFWHYLGF
ncbi:MAG: RIP metalloprotease RseP [Candidatus Omnitrophica bacterium]|nr:RIP metalloprotease RseP [Candidatus Omnitrophota bacterium]